MPRSATATNPIANPHGHRAPPPRPPAVVTAIIPTANNAPTLDSVLATLRRQTQPIDLILIDTSPDNRDATITEAQHGTAPNTRFLRLAPVHRPNRSAIVAEAIDLAVALTVTEWILLTHDDVWLHRQRLVQDMIAIAESDDTDIVAYEMSDRSHITTEWRQIPSHTCTLLRRSTAIFNALRWNLDDPLTGTHAEPPRPGWPDTETQFGRRVKALAVPTTFIGPEPNEPHYRDQNLVHRRSYTSHALHAPELAIADAQWINAQIAAHKDPN